MLEKLTWRRRKQPLRPPNNHTVTEGTDASADEGISVTATSPQWDVDDRDPLVRQAELVISNVLRWGVVLSAVIIAIGVITFYLKYSSDIARGLHDQTFPHSLAAVGAGLAQGDPLAIIMLGLLVLLATPFMRVLVSIGAFALERDWRYVVITATVLTILLISFFLGRGGA